MNAWRLIPILTLLLALLFPAYSKATDLNETIHTPAVLQELIAEALANNRNLSATQREIDALNREIKAAGTLDDPRFGLGLLNLPADTFRFDQEPMTQKQITLAQRIPWFGKLDLKTQRAALKALQLESVLAAKKLELMRQVADAYYELGFISVSQEINARLIAHLDQIVRSAETRYASGKGLQQDVLQAHVEQSRLFDERSTLKRKYRGVENRINALLNRPDYAPISITAPTDLPDIPTTVDGWKQTALTANADLKSLRIKIDQTKTEIELARKGYYPDPDLRLAYGQRDDDQAGQSRADFVSASIVFTLPLWKNNKQDRQLEAAMARREAAIARYKDLASQLPHRIDAIAVELDQLRENYNLYQEAILIQTAQWAESARFAYEVGKLDFSTMISAQLKELRFERQAKQYLFQFYRKLAALDEMLGGELFQTTELRAAPDEPETVNTALNRNDTKEK